MQLTNADLHDLTEFRHALHRNPEVSGADRETARRVVEALPSPDRVVTGLGGHGVAAVYAGNAPGPTVMIRAELDALLALAARGIADLVAAQRAALAQPLP